MFFTGLAQEFRLTQRSFGWAASQMADVAYASLDAAWIDTDRDARLAGRRAEAGPPRPQGCELDVRDSEM